MLVSVGQPLFALPFVAAFDELLALPGGVGDHQAAAVEHADELLQLLGADRLRRKLALEPLGDLVEARLAVEHLQDRELLFLEAVVLQADRVLDDPVDPPLVALLPRRADRAACGSAASARNWKPDCRQAWPWRGSRVESRGSRAGDAMSRCLLALDPRPSTLDSSRRPAHVAARRCRRCSRWIVIVAGMPSRSSQLPCSWRLATSARTLYVPSQRTSELT